MNLNLFYIYCKGIKTFPLYQFCFLKMNIIFNGLTLIIRQCHYHITKTVFKISTCIIPDVTAHPIRPIYIFMSRHSDRIIIQYYTAIPNIMF